MRFGLFVFIAACGCSSAGDQEDSFTCTIGSLTGTWRTHYEETNGNCGPIPDETNVFKPGPPDPACTVRTDKVSADRCRYDSDWTCPTTDKNGTQQWTVVMRQTAAGRLEGTGTVQLNHATGTCRSTYNMTVTKL
jgi:hypothetical protein